MLKDARRKDARLKGALKTPPLQADEGAKSRLSLPPPVRRNAQLVSVNKDDPVNVTMFALLGNVRATQHCGVSSTLARPMQVALLMRLRGSCIFLLKR
jgi:hypothetical protein